jgi:hypothetical protein
VPLRLDTENCIQRLQNDKQPIDTRLFPGIDKIDIVSLDGSAVQNRRQAAHQYELNLCFSQASQYCN